MKAPKGNYLKFTAAGILSISALAVTNCSVAITNGYAARTAISSPVEGNLVKPDTTTINVKQAGATGDGSTDDFAAIYKAMNQVSGPVKVYFPGGTYLLKHSLSTLHPGTTFAFDSGAKLLSADNASGILLIKDDNCRVIGGNFVGNGQTSKDLRQGYGILMQGVSNCQVSHCTFNNISGVDILLLSNGVKGCVNCIVDHNTITNPAFARTAVQDAAGIMVGYSSTGYFHEKNIVEYNIIDGNETLAHGIAFITHGKDNTITHNIVKNCLRYGIVAYESKYEDFKLERTTVTYNTVSHIGTVANDPSKFGSVYGMGIYLMKSHYSIVRGNRVSDCNVNTSNAETLPPGAIALNGSTYCTVDSNIITNAHRYGMAIAMAFHTTITNNSIDGAGESGIYLVNTAFNTITNNTINNVTVFGIKGVFGNIGRDSYAKQMTIADYQNLSTGQGIEIAHNSINCPGKVAVAVAGEDPDSKTNYAGNQVSNMSIHDNKIVAKPNSISFHNAVSGANDVRNNKFQ